MKKSTLWLLNLLLVACATTDEDLPRVHPAAYGYEMIYNATPPEHPPPEPNSVFFHRDCFPTEGKDFYSATSYFCDDLGM